MRLARTRYTKIFYVSICLGISLIAIDSHAANNNDLLVEQIGNSHKTAIRQSGSSNRVTVQQNQSGGTSNRAIVHQGGLPRASEVGTFFEFSNAEKQTKFEFNLTNASTLEGRLRDDNDFFDVDELEHPSDSIALRELLNLGFVSNPTQNNTAEVIQRGNNNNALAVQVGQSNDLRTKQLGNRNLGIHIQKGNGNATELIQNGDDNRNALIGTNGARGNSHPFTLLVEGNRAANGLAVQVTGPKTFGGFRVTPNRTGGFNMAPIQ